MENSQNLKMLHLVSVKNFQTLDLAQFVPQFCICNGDCNLRKVAEFRKISCVALGVSYFQLIVFQMTTT